MERRLRPVTVLALLAYCGAATAGPLADAVQPYVDRHELAGAVMLVADPSQVLATECAGWADVAAKRPMAPDTLFWIASETKSITAMVFMMLVDEGRVALDDPVTKYLPEFADQLVVDRQATPETLTKPERPITLRHLLSHTSGLPFSTPLERPTLDLFLLSARVSSYAKARLGSQPGTRYAYSNAGINTVACVLEVVTQQSYEQFLDQRLLAPLGLKDTTFWPSEAQVARLAKCYRPNPAKDNLVETPLVHLHYPLTDRTKRTAMPAGGLFSTAAELARILQVMLNGGQLDGRRYLSDAAVAEMTRRQTPAGLKESYGLGWSVGGGSFGHGGAASTNCSVDTRQRRIHVWMVQHFGFAGHGDQAQGAFRKAAQAIAAKR